MGKRGENIRKRKDGRWEARVKICKDGKQVYHSIYGHSYKEVKEKKVSYQINNSNNTISSSEINKNNISMEQVLASWLIEKELHLKKSALLKYKTIIDSHIIPELGMKSVNEITTEEINIFLSNKLQDGRKDGNGGLSKSYIKTMAIIISSCLEFAVSAGIRKPIYGKICKLPAVRTNIISLNNETQELLKNSLSPATSLTELGMILALNTGLRIGEVCALQWNDIDLNENIIHVRHSIIRIASQNVCSSKKTELIMDMPKTSTSVRDIPINTTLKILLKKYENVENDIFILSGTHKFISPRTFEYRFHKVLEEYNIPNFNFHILRHTFATRCIECGIDVKTLSEIMGHSNVNITLNNYVHPSFENKRIQMEKLNEI